MTAAALAGVYHLAIPDDSRLGGERRGSMDRAQRILGIAGSVRRQSLNRIPFRAAQELAPQGMAIEIVERLYEIPPYKDVRDPSPANLTPREQASGNHEREH
ncbi:MAG TPA: hypothetical protein VGQ44_04290 [Gemmatimonadaceae bacterium]|nr:hypothetical protein [Gemmatimonadaceae bacterium]